jgi:hypothetical protein
MRLVAGLALAALGASPTLAEDQPTTRELAEWVISSWPTQGVRQDSGVYAPLDECRDLEGAHAFRLTLYEAVLMEDTETLLELASPAIELDFGGGEGREELRRRLGATDQMLWQELDAALSLGCATDDDGNLVMPWYFAQELGDRDPFVTMIVVGEDVPIYAKPDNRSEAFGTVPWNLVTIEADRESESAYTKVRTDDGRVGFVDSNALRHVLDYRLIASRLEGRWRITAFIAGD